MKTKLSNLTAYAIATFLGFHTAPIVFAQDGKTNAPVAPSATAQPTGAATKEALEQSRELTMPALVKAAKQSDIEELKLLLSKGDNVNTNWHGVTALMFASASGNMQMVKLLVEKGAEINHLSDGGVSAIYQSDIDNFYADSKKSHPEIVDYLVTSALTVNGLRSPSVKEIRDMAYSVVNEAGMNAGGIGIELLTVRRNNTEKNTIEVTGNVSSWSGSVAMYHLGVWRLSIVLDGDKWKATGKRIDQ